jgi:hypothetical protein
MQCKTHTDKCMGKKEEEEEEEASSHPLKNRRRGHQVED